MNKTLCIWFGFLDGAAIGLLIAAARIDAPLPIMPPVSLIVGGLTIAVIVAIVELLLGRLLTQGAWVELALLAFGIALPAGVLFAPLAYHVAVPLLALLICAGLGVLLGLLVCNLVCGGRGASAGIAR